MQNALEAASKVLNIRGQVMPATSQKVRLRAKMSDGEIVEGESEISAYPGKIGRDVKIVRMTTVPKAPMAVGDALEAIKEADLITLGPGSLYTSVLPNLLVPEILEAIRKSGAPVLYICNVMTQPGETTGYTVGDHLKALVDHIGGGVVDFVLANNGTPSPEVLKKYEKPMPFLYPSTGRRWNPWAPSLLKQTFWAEPVERCRTRKSFPMNHPYPQPSPGENRAGSIGRVFEEESLMSFTEQVKNELARIRRDEASCRRAELLALLRMSGSFVTGSRGRWGLEFSTGNSAVARRVLVYLKKTSDSCPAPWCDRAAVSGRKTYTLWWWSLQKRGSPSWTPWAFPPWPA